VDHYDGSTWTNYTMDYGKKVSGLGQGGGEIYASGYNGGAYQFDGTDFVDIVFPWGSYVAIRDVVADASGDGWFVGDRGFIWQYDASADAWEQELYLNSSTKNFSAIAIDGDNLYVVGDGGVWTATIAAEPEPPCDSPFSADFNCDKTVDFEDFAIMANEWMDTDPNIYSQ